MKHSVSPSDAAVDRISRACASFDIDGIIGRRPEMPQGVTHWEELKADHQLIVDWHEQQWASLGEALEEW
jgi:hypothetical protein